nr:MAG TPA: hypothetical protein [Crassvirales sp.]
MKCSKKSHQTIYTLCKSISATIIKFKLMKV